MEIKKTGVVKGKADDVTGNLVRVKVAKNKLAPPFRTADFELTYGAGVSRSGEVVDLGVAAGVLARSGAWFTFATPVAAAAVNAALVGAARRAAAGGAAERAPGAVAAPSKASDILATLAASKGRKGKKGVVAEGSAGDAAGAIAEDSAGPRAVSAAESISAPSPSDAETVAAGTPFAQGREKCKAWFEARPAAMEAVAGLIASALKHGVAVAAVPESTAAIGEVTGQLPGAALDEEEELLGKH